MSGSVLLSSGGHIKDFGGHSRFLATDDGDTVLGRADGTAALTINAADGDVSIAGNLVVQGAQTFLETTEVMIQDKSLMLAVPGAIKEGLSVSDANPGVITSAGHGLNDEEFVLLFGHSGNKSIADGVYQVKNKSTNTFEIRAAGAGANLDTSGESGATTINIPDTVGYSIPFQFGNTMKELIAVSYTHLTLPTTPYV